MKAVAIVDSKKCRITLYILGGVPVLDKHVFRRRNDKRSLYISLYIFEKGKVKQSVNPRSIFTASIWCL